MSASQRRYRVRIAQRGASEVDGYVEFILELGDLAEPPVVRGSLVHPLDGATELRPLTVLGIDTDGGLIAAFTEGGRWAALGRLCDLQWQEVLDGSSADWVTYGVGRVSGLDEQDGPGLFRIEISDETYAARRGVVFQHADTTQLWPSGLRWEWRGIRPAPPASGEDTTPLIPAPPTDNVRRIELTFGGEGNAFWKDITAELIDWIRDDTVPEPDADPDAGNFEYLRLRYPDSDGHMRDWEVIGFAKSSPVWSLETLETPDESGGGLNSFLTITMWVREPSGVTPAEHGDGYLYAPKAPPSSQLRLHLGVASSEHPYGNDPIYPPSGLPQMPGEGAGWLHIADATRRVWQELGLRYDEDALAALEQDLSFPAIAPVIEKTPEDPHKYMQEEWWGPNGLLALRDRQGRMKLVDIRPPSLDADLSGLPLLDSSNSANHRWRLVGREQMNSVTWEWVRWGNDMTGLPERTSIQVGTLGVYRTVNEEPGPVGLDGLYGTVGRLGPVEPEDIDVMPHRPRTFSARAGLEPLGLEQGTGVVRNLSVYYSGRGATWQDVAGAMTEFLLAAFQDGAMRGQCEIKGSLADELDEGDYLLVDCAKVKVANPGVRARGAKMLVLLLSLTRFPAYAEAEYLVLRPADIFLCPIEDDPSTWLVSPATGVATMRIDLGDIGDHSEGLVFEVRARKSTHITSTFFGWNPIDGAGDSGEQVDMTVRLMHGDTELQVWNETDIPGSTWQIYHLTVTQGVREAISDWAGLSLEITRGGEVNSSFELAWRHLQISRITVVQPSVGVAS